MGAASDTKRLADLAREKMDIFNSCPKHEFEAVYINGAVARLLNPEPLGYMCKHCGYPSDNND